jgi:hypothetical protein
VAETADFCLISGHLDWNFFFVLFLQILSQAIASKQEIIETQLYRVT